MSRPLWTVVPMRGIERGKSRLIPALDDAERAFLNRWLLVRTLTVIRHAQATLRRCVVVSPCERTLELARLEGAGIVREPREATDLNHAAALGATCAAESGATRIMVIACDLPDLDRESLQVFTAAGMDAGSMVLAPDKHGSGTNALIVDARCHGEFRFGEGSFMKHQEWAATRGWSVSVVARPALAFDLDTPEDLAAWSGRTRDTPLCTGRCSRTD